MNSILKRFVRSRRVLPDKRHLIDFVFRKVTPTVRSFADLGGCWAVDGAYTFYTLNVYPIERAFLVDTDVTPKAAERAKHHSQLTVIEGNFSNAQLIQSIANIDCVFLFDVLLHQVNPDWDEVLRRYAQIARVLVIFNQQFTNFEKTTRLMDLGEEEYFRNVPHTQDEYADLFLKLDEIHPRYGIPHRDVHNYWQWGMVDDDVIRVMENLGFKMQYYANYGQFRDIPQCENHAFVFQKG